MSETYMEMIDRLRDFCIRGRICPECGVKLDPVWSRDADGVYLECPRCKDKFDEDRIHND